jgi:hypothetical protein
MSLKLLPFAFALAVAQLSTTADAASPVPERAGDFVVYCKSNFKECKNKILSLDVAAMAGALWGKDNKTQVCVTPDDVNDTVAAKQILAWLTDNDAAANMTTANAVRAAEKAIWNCR